MPNDEAREQLIRDKYPFPISHAYAYLESRADPNDRYQALLACFEVTLKTIAGLLKPGDVVHTKKCPDLHAAVVDARFVTYKGKRWRYNDWGMHVTGWSAINVYQQVILTRTGETLDDLRKRLRQGFTHR